MDERSQYGLLKAIGIDYWLSRLPNASVLRSLKPIFCAPLLVVLPEDPARLDDEPSKILYGMLSVLKLDKSAIALSWLSETSVTDQELTQEIEKWAPLTVLLLGESFSKMIIQPHNAFVCTTHHPIELQQSPHLKAKAYQDLLCLKEKHLSAKMA